MWYYLKDEVQLGPIEDADIPSLIEQGEITVSTHVFQEGMENWVLASQMDWFTDKEADRSLTWLENSVGVGTIPKWLPSPIRRWSYFRRLAFLKFPYVAYVTYYSYRKTMDHYAAGLSGDPIYSHTELITIVTSYVIVIGLVWYFAVIPRILDMGVRWWFCFLLWIPFVGTLFSFVLLFAPSGSLFKYLKEEEKSLEKCNAEEF
ncbi:MAG: GYF domain-containing protein [Verrucomicrobiota bacterium]